MFNDVKGRQEADLGDARDEQHLRFLVLRRLAANPALTHREFTWDGKHHLVKFVKEFAMLPDMIQFVHLIRSLRDYCHLRHDFIPPGRRCGSDFA